ILTNGCATYQIAKAKGATDGKHNCASLQNPSCYRHRSYRGCRPESILHWSRDTWGARKLGLHITAVSPVQIWRPCQASGCTIPYMGIRGEERPGRSLQGD